MISYSDIKDNMEMKKQKINGNALRMSHQMWQIIFTLKNQCLISAGEI